MLAIPTEYTVPIMRIYSETIPFSGKNSCHWKLSIGIFMINFVGPTRGKIYGKNSLVEHTKIKLM